MNRRTRRVLSAAAAWLVCASLSQASPKDTRAPQVPENLQVPAGNEATFRARAAGVQIYVCNPSAADPTQFAWSFKAPEAKLLGARGRVVGVHYAGPTWESERSKVVGAMLQSAPSPDPDAIPWLLLQAKSTTGPGVFDRVTFVQRLRTGGGKAPATGCDAASVGRELRVPYTAEYVFYRGTPAGPRVTAREPSSSRRRSSGRRS